MPRQLGTERHEQPSQNHSRHHGYFVADRADHGVGGKVVFNRVTGLKDSWGK